MIAHPLSVRSRTVDVPTLSLSPAVMASGAAEALALPAARRSSAGFVGGASFKG
jgi:hypothetical protein